MATQTITVQITIPEDLYHRIEEASGRPVDDAIVELIEDHYPGSARRSKAEDTRRLREAMAGRIWEQEDVDRFMERLGLTPMSDEELEQVMRDMPVLDPPTSEVLIRMRDEERY